MGFQSDYAVSVCLLLFINGLTDPRFLCPDDLIRLRFRFRLRSSRKIRRLQFYRAEQSRKYLSYDSGDILGHISLYFVEMFNLLSTFVSCGDNVGIRTP